MIEAMSKSCAVIAYIHSDGGEKVGPTAVKDDQEFFSRLTHLITNPEQRTYEGKKLAQRFLDLYDLSRSGPSLIKACQLAVKHFKDRVKVFV